MAVSVCIFHTSAAHGARDFTGSRRLRFFSMTPERFRECMDRVYGSLRRGAIRLDLHETTVRRMAGLLGENPQPIPPAIATWLEKAATFFEKNEPRKPPRG